MLELTHADRTRIFNLGYYTWVEQQGVSLDDFDRRRDQRFWREPRREHPGLGSPDRGVQRRSRRTSARQIARRRRTGDPVMSGVQTYASSGRTWRARPQPAREGHVARGGGVVRPRRRLGRHRRQHDVAHADGDDLGADSRRPDEAVLRARHRLERRRPAVRVRRQRSHHHELVQPGHPVGRVEGDAPLRRDGQGAVRGVEPHGGGHAVPRRRDGRAVHADPLDARVRTSSQQRPEAVEIDLPVHARSCCWCRRSTRTSR